MCEFRENSENSSKKENVSAISTIEAGPKEPTSILRKAVSFDHALSETKFGKFNYFIIIVAGLILSNVLLETLGISFVLPISQCDLNLSTKAKGILSAIGFAGIITSSHLWGFLADTTGRRKVIRPTLFIAFFLTVLSSFSNNFWYLVILRFLNGFFVSGGSATVYAYLGEFHTTKTRSRAIMGASFIFGVGAMMLPALAWAVINQQWSFHIPLLNIVYKPWRLFIVVCGIPGLVCALCLLKIPESPKFTLSQGRQEETIKILKNIYANNTGKSGDNYAITAIKEDTNDVAARPKASMNKSNPVVSLFRSMWDQTAPLFMKEYLRKTVLACIIQFGIFATSNGMYMWFPGILNEMVEFMNQNPGNKTTICEVVYSNARRIQDMEAAGNLTSKALTCSETLEISTYQHSLSLEIMYAVGFALIGFIINAVGKLPILFAILVGCGACGVAAIMVDIPIVAIYLYVVLLLCGLGVTVVNATTVDLYPTHLRAMAVCISLMMGRVGSVVGANFVGLILDTSCEAAFLSSGISLIICGFLGFLIPSPPKSLQKPVSRRTSIISMTGN